MTFLMTKNEKRDTNDMCNPWHNNYETRRKDRKTNLEEKNCSLLSSTINTSTS
jgi:hypothetical protein